MDLKRGGHESRGSRRKGPRTCVNRPSAKEVLLVATWRVQEGIEMVGTVVM